MSKSNYWSEYYYKNKEKCFEKGRRYRLKTPELSMLYKARSRTKERKLPFCNLEREDIIIPEICPILGIPLKKGLKGPIASSPSLDRIIPELGYVKGNVQVISQRANVMKNDATPEELIKFANWVLKNYG
jgi:hypothetical protein